MHKVTHRLIESNGIRMHIAEQGEGPLVLLCHGFPESWYSWRHQLAALAAAGFRAVAPDMRGYGQTDRPAEIEKYTLLHLVGDMVGVLDALEAPTAVIAGHDWGAPVAWHAALLRPDRFRAVIALSVPFRPRGSRRPTSVMPQTADAVFYQLYFQAPGIAEAELGCDARRTLRMLLRTPAKELNPLATMVPRDGGWLSRMPEPESLPEWLGEADLDFYAKEFERTGFCGGLNWYRNIDRNWELLAPYARAQVQVPALYIAGDRDLVLSFPGMKELLPSLTKFVPHLKRTLLLPGCGHWTQQERPQEVNAAMLEFLWQIGRGGESGSTPPSARRILCSPGPPDRAGGASAAGRLRVPSAHECTHLQLEVRCNGGPEHHRAGRIAILSVRSDYVRGADAQ